MGCRPTHWLSSQTHQRMPDQAVRSEDKGFKVVPQVLRPGGEPDPVQVAAPSLWRKVILTFVKAVRMTAIGVETVATVGQYWA